MGLSGKRGRGLGVDERPEVVRSGCGCLVARTFVHLPSAGAPAYRPGANGASRRLRCTNTGVRVIAVGPSPERGAPCHPRDIERGGIRGPVRGNGTEAQKAADHAQDLWAEASA